MVKEGPERGWRHLLSIREGKERSKVRAEDKIAWPAGSRAVRRGKVSTPINLSIRAQPTGKEGKEPQKEGRDNRPEQCSKRRGYPC